MLFEWDREKAKKNFKKHKITFEEAVTVFNDPISATFEDPDHSLNEERLITLGYSSNGHLLVISHTDRKEKIRIISARLATKNEKKNHES